MYRLHARTLTVSSVAKLRALATGSDFSENARRYFGKSVPDGEEGTKVGAGWLAERFKAPGLKFDAGRPYLCHLVPKYDFLQSLKGSHRLLVCRLVPRRIGAFGSKVGSRGRCSLF